MQEANEPLSKAQEFLGAAISEGYCPYIFSRAKQPSIEATAWSIIALVQSRPHMIEKAVAFLLKSQNKDGGWPTSPGIGRSDWTSAPALLALRLVKHYQPGIAPDKAMDAAIKDGIHYLITSRTDLLVPVLRFMLLFMDKSAGLDTNVGRGWAWNNNLYGWVEPTAYSLWALKFPSLVDHQLVKSSISHGNQYLLAHACKSGGWNHGQFYCLGEYLPPYILTTAEALLALADIPAGKTVKTGMDYLTANIDEPFSAWSLALSILALDTYDYECSYHFRMLEKMQGHDGSFGSTYLSTAFCTLALDTANANNFFKLGRKYD